MPIILSSQQGFTKMKKIIKEREITYTIGYNFFCKKADWSVEDCPKYGGHCWVDNTPNIWVETENEERICKHCGLKQELIITREWKPLKNHPKSLLNSVRILKEKTKMKNNSIKEKRKLKETLKEEQARFQAEAEGEAMEREKSEDEWRQQQERQAQWEDEQSQGEGGR